MDGGARLAGTHDRITDLDVRRRRRQHCREDRVLMVHYKYFSFQNGHFYNKTSGTQGAAVLLPTLLWAEIATSDDSVQCIYAMCQNMISALSAYI